MILTNLNAVTSLKRARENTTPVVPRLSEPTASDEPDEVEVGNGSEGSYVAVTERDNPEDRERSAAEREGRRAPWNPDRGTRLDELA
jgi:hypothetical protein